MNTEQQDEILGQLADTPIITSVYVGEWKVESQHNWIPPAFIGVLEFDGK